MNFNTCNDCKYFLRRNENVGTCRIRLPMDIPQHMRIKKVNEQACDFIDYKVDWDNLFNDRV